MLLVPRAAVFLSLTLFLTSSTLLRARVRALSRALSRQPQQLHRSHVVRLQMCSHEGPASEDPLVKHLVGSGSEISHYWIEKLRRLRRPKARDAVARLSPANPLGYDLAAKGAGRVAEWAVEQKRFHSDKLIVYRQGEFYETCGVDSILLAEHLGLNLMGRRDGAGDDAPRAGFPVKNLQSSLKDLVGAGLSVAMFEQLVDVDSAQGPSRKTKAIKERAFTQIVSSGHSAYLYDLCLSTENIEFGDDVPAVGLLLGSCGILLCEVFVNERVVTVSERMTEESARSALEPYGSRVSPCFVQGAQNFRDGSFLPDFTAISGYSDQDFPSIVLKKVAESFQVDPSSFTVRRKIFDGDRPRPVYTSTALQIGLLGNRNVPPLVPQLLPQNSPAHAHRFLRRWVSSPPPKEMAEHMRAVCSCLLGLAEPLPLVSPVPLSKAVSLLLARQANAQLFRDLAGNALAVVAMLDPGEQGSGAGLRDLLPPLLALTGYESGTVATAQQLLQGARRVSAAIGAVVLSDDMLSEPCHRPSIANLGGAESKGSEKINDFFRRNEAEFRGVVRSSLPQVAELYRTIDEAALALQDAIANDFPTGADVAYDAHNNRLHISIKRGDKKTPVLPSYFAPRDRDGKEIPGGKYTTEGVERALAVYRAAAEAGPAVVTTALKQLSSELTSELMTIQHCCHLANILYAVSEHAAAARQKGWVLPAANAGRQMVLRGATPYWIGRERAAKNDVDLQGLFLLTAPNMAGKSTLMRTVLVCALLGNCGLCVPCDEASIPRYDSFFLRTSSFDVPSEAKSAFALEMDDVRVAMRDATELSLVMIDELGKGTSSREGASLAGAVLEWLDRRRVSGIFATHLHEVFTLGLALDSVAEKQMAFQIDASGNVERFLYSLQDGRCTESLALYTARSSGVDEGVISRADELAAVFDKRCRPYQSRQRRRTRHDLASATAADPLVARAAPRSLESVLSMIADRGYEAFCVIEPSESPPASLEGSSCVYIIQALGVALNGKGDMLYVGETNSIRQRLAEHRTSTFRGMAVRAAVARQPNKSAARRAEAATIAALKSRGVELANVSDGARL